LTTWFAPAHLTLSLIILIWDVVLAGRIAQLRQAPRVFAAVTGLVGLLVLPALLVHLATSTVITGRAVVATDWIWPAVLILFTVQAGYALAGKLVNYAWGLPIFVYNLTIATIVVVRYAVAHGATPPTLLIALISAQSTAMTVATWSALTMITPFYVNIPMVAPAFPALRRLTATFRGVMAASAVVWMVLIFGIGWPRAIQAVQEERQHADDRLRERPKGDFRVGLKILPDVAGLPPAIAVKNDLRLADSVGVDALAIVVVPGAGRTVIDSVGRILDRIRGDSTTVIVAVGYHGILLPELRHLPLNETERLETVRRVVTRLRPTILLPAEDPYGVGARVLGHLGVERWQRYLTDASRLAKQINPPTRIGVSVAGYEEADSILYAWAGKPGSPIDILGFTLFPARLGLAEIEEAFERAADRWMKASPSSKDHWVFGTGGYPLAYGERAQERTIWQVLSWATDHPNIKGVVVYEAGDYGEARGLRAPNGRVRLAGFSLRRAVRGLKESIQP
jgi:hypothetical protein